MKGKKKLLQLEQAVCLPFMVFLISLLCGIPPANAQTPQQIAKKAFGSTVLLVMEDANGQPISLGSGFFVRKGQIATNLHVVEGAIRGYAKLVGQKTKYDIEGITAIDPQRDLVILKVSAVGLQALSLGDSDAVQVGESVYAVGNPRGLEGTFSQGIISSIREVGTDKLLQITTPDFSREQWRSCVKQDKRSDRSFCGNLPRWAESQFRHPFKLSQGTGCESGCRETFVASKIIRIEQFHSR